MSSPRFVAVLGAACLVLAPSLSWAQCQKGGQASGKGSVRTPKANMQTPLQQGGSSSLSVRQFNQPLGGQQTPTQQMALQQNLQQQMTLQQNQQMFLGMSLAMTQQYTLQEQIKQQLLTYASEAPTENLQRELKNTSPFVRWAASVELKRRSADLARTKTTSVARSVATLEPARQPYIEMLRAVPGTSGSIVGPPE